MSDIDFFLEGSIGFIVLNRPKKRNALSLQSLTEFREIIKRIKGKDDCSIIIIKGRGKDFCAGHDLNELRKYQHSIHDVRKIFSLSAEIMQEFHVLPQPVIAQVQGNASAAGCQIVAASDLAVAESGALFSTPGVKIGLFCSTPMVPLCRAIGRKKALEMLFTGLPLSAAEAQTYGLINKVVESNNLEHEVISLADHINRYSAKVIELGKKAFYHQIDHSESDAYLFSKEVIALNCLHDDAVEGIDAMLEKRPPQWKK